MKPALPLSLPGASPRHDRQASAARGRVAAAVLRALLRYGRAHRGWFFKGTAAALAVVAGRLSLPLPLKSLTDVWTGAAAPALLPAALDPALALGGAFFALILLLGGADHLERFYFARFTIHTANDLRAAALAAALARESRPATGDLLARLLGDTGRVKSGMDGFLVQVATNGAVFAGMTAVLAVIEPALGLIFVAAGLLIAAVTAHAAARVLRIALDHREREAQFANRVRDALEAEPAAAADMRRGDPSEEAQLTHAQGVATWATHAIFGAAVLAALAAGSNAVAAGRIGVAEMVLFMMYALMMRGPLVRLARQGAKSGRILAAGHRLLQLIETPAKEPR
ncbi:ABC transporter ATP-binding protein [Betaproteobacteria bacterium PRO7]|jgi:ABC-type multidrug transport system fused ATPase/permease subunit|nr:ABC transporter ATP-binding protein [Betaproteobacteria bacterium PRO7]